MTNRMTDERLAVRIAAIEPYKDRPDFEDEWELLQALKAERKSLNDCARDNTKFRQRIRELGEALAEWVADGKAMEQRIREMKKQVVNMNRHITDLQDDKRLLNDRISKLEAKLERVRKLPAHEATLENGRTGFIVDAASLVKALADDE